VSAPLATQASMSSSRAALPPVRAASTPIRASSYPRSMHGERHRPHHRLANSCRPRPQLFPGRRSWPDRSATRGASSTVALQPCISRLQLYRIHMPYDGTLQAAWYVPGRLFSVNATTAAAVSISLHATSGWCGVFDDAPLGFALIMVGALFVGSMSTRWHGDVTPARGGGRANSHPDGTWISGLRRGADIGPQLGSTVILLLPPGAANWLPGLAAGSRIEVGQALAGGARHDAGELGADGHPSHA